MFNQQVYKATYQIPKGRVSTYKFIGDTIGSKAYRHIGKVLSKNPDAPNVPCHRVVRNDGSIGGFMGSTDITQVQHKIDLLESEGVVIKDGKVVGFEKIVYKPYKLK